MKDQYRATTEVYADDAQGPSQQLFLNIGPTGKKMFNKINSNDFICFNIGLAWRSMQFHMLKPVHTQIDLD